MAALSGSGSFVQAVTTWYKSSRPRRLEFVRLFVRHPLDLPTKPGFYTGSNPGALSAPEKSADAPSQNWNFHVQNTDIVQGYPAFSSKYSGPNSLSNGGKTRETISLDLLGGARLWSGAEAHVDALMYQGFGVDNARRG